ncbi:hypothetical protein VFPPC_15843 [Pochonia chlamydosporia 170]|uniref:Uncharacterized protein n=1 Tax=Pochonia chlamydosporia 170 TaxID=1380566 RepID=A0A179FU71_METCM|nr:hypothetical protein VFPPC_15843 [Pochonia chlamydosporia 170]OAQ68559.1 hypothetical protein VFPPC_15843 [Pochonia chlamydosporia 170]
MFSFGGDVRLSPFGLHCTLSAVPLSSLLYGSGGEWRWSWSRVAVCFDREIVKAILEKMLIQDLHTRPAINLQQQALLVIDLHSGGVCC